MGDKCIILFSLLLHGRLFQVHCHFIVGWEIEKVVLVALAQLVVLVLKVVLDPLAQLVGVKYTCISLLHVRLTCAVVFHFRYYHCFLPGGR